MRLITEIDGIPVARPFLIRHDFVTAHNVIGWRAFLSRFLRRLFA